MKLKDKFKAIELRKKGLSYKSILSRLEVSKSTLSLWLRDIELTPVQIKNLLTSQEKGRYVAAQKKKLDRVKRTKEIVDSARSELPLLVENPLFIAGLCLYWAEGAKNPTESVKFANSDETMILFMMKWFREVCLVPDSKFRVHLHIHDLHVKKDVGQYWSELVNIPLGQFYKPYIKHTSLGQRRNILYNGTCSITISDKKLFRKILGWKVGLREFYNISPRSSTDRTEGF